jgi:hypothetical protein
LPALHDLVAHLAGRPALAEIPAGKCSAPVATITAALLVVSLGIGLLSASRTASVFPIGLRSAKGSPIKRALPEPPDWKQFVALAAPVLSRPTPKGLG